MVTHFETHWGEAHARQEQYRPACDGPACAGPGPRVGPRFSQEDRVMGEPTLYERLGGIFNIAAVVNDFSDRLVKNRRSSTRTPSCTSGTR
jgi:hypothetical protein